MHVSNATVRRAVWAMPVGYASLWPWQTCEQPQRRPSSSLARNRFAVRTSLVVTGELRLAAFSSLVRIASLTSPSSPDRVSKLPHLAPRVRNRVAVRTSLVVTGELRLAAFSSLVRNGLRTVADYNACSVRREMDDIVTWRTGMSFRTVASANGVVSVFFGAVALVVPAVLTSLYGVDLTDREAMMVRLLGASYLSFGVIAWAARGVTDAAARAAIAAGAVAGWGLSLPVSVVGQLAGHANALGWTTPVLEIAFALAWTFVLIDARRGGARATA